MGNTQYFIVAPKTRNGAKTCSVLIVDQNEKTIKSFSYPCDDEDAKMAAWDAADDYVEQVLKVQS